MHNIGACCSLRPPTHTLTHYIRCTCIILAALIVPCDGCVYTYLKLMKCICNLSLLTEREMYVHNPCSFYSHFCSLHNSLTEIFARGFQSVKTVKIKFIPQIRAHAVMYTSIQICEILCQFDLFHCCLAHL